MLIEREDLMRIIIATDPLLKGKPIGDDIRKDAEKVVAKFVELINEDMEDDEYLEEEYKKREQDISYAIGDCHHFIRWKISLDNAWMDEDEEEDDYYERMYQRNKRKGWQTKKLN